MIAYEKELLALAYESVTRVRGDDVRLVVGPDDYDTDHVYAGTVNYAGDRNGWTKPTLAEALTALLRDLGVDVPERPSAEGLAHMASAADANGWRYLKEFAARDPRGPMYVLALMEGGVE